MKTLGHYVKCWWCGTNTRGVYRCEMCGMVICHQCVKYSEQGTDRCPKCKKRTGYTNARKLGVHPRRSPKWAEETR